MTHPRTYRDDDPYLADIRRICLALPASVEVEAWGRPTFRVVKKMFAIYARNDDGPLFVFRPDAAERPAHLADERVTLPRYHGARGWLGLQLDGRTELDEVAELADTSYRQVAPKRLQAQ